MRDSIEEKGLHSMRNSTKLILSEQNHRIFYCNRPEYFQKCYDDPFQLIQMINSKELDFNYELGNINESAKDTADLSDEDDELPDFLDGGRDAPKTAADQIVFEVDGETLVQNVQTPYLFITFKPYADRSQILKGDLSLLT